MESRIVQWFQDHVHDVYLNAANVRTDYILNWGGFVNQSFKVTDGVNSYHLKLSNDKDNKACLRKWYDLHELLEERYHAPELLNWVDLPSTDYS